MANEIPVIPPDMRKVYLRLQAVAEFARPPRADSGFFVGGGGRTGPRAWD